MTCHCIPRSGAYATYVVVDRIRAEAIGRNEGVDVQAVCGCARGVTGVTWAAGDLWHATLENEESELRRLDPDTGQVLEVLEMPSGVLISGLESDGRGQFFCGAPKSGKLRVLRWAS